MENRTRKTEHNKQMLNCVTAKSLQKWQNKNPKTSSPSASYQISQIPPKAAVLQQNVQKHQCASLTNNKPQPKLRLWLNMCQQHTKPLVLQTK